VDCYPLPLQAAKSSTPPRHAGIPAGYSATKAPNHSQTEPKAAKPPRRAGTRGSRVAGAGPSAPSRHPRVRTVLASHCRHPTLPPCRWSSPRFCLLLPFPTPLHSTPLPAPPVSTPTLPAGAAQAPPKWRSTRGRWWLGSSPSPCSSCSAT
jgi:hypothetical protein